MINSNSDDKSKGNKLEIFRLDKETHLSEIDPYLQLNTIEDGES
jgi:hypothetical protein